MAADLPINPVPFEVIAAPFTAYIADVGTAFPKVDETPGVGWTKVGSHGPLSYDDSAGVKVSHSQSTNLWRSLGDSGPRKAFRTEEDLKIAFTLVDVTLEQYQLAMNGNAVTTVAPATTTVGYRKMGLSRGLGVETKALLIRADVSPYKEQGRMQYEVPYAAQTGNPEPVYLKGAPAMLALEFTALVDPDATIAAERFGRLVAEDLDS